MTPRDMENLANRLVSILADEFGVIAHKLTLHIHVDENYYESIKNNFPDQYPSNSLVLVGAKKDWAVLIFRKLA